MAAEPPFGSAAGLACAPLLLTLTRSVRPVRRSRTKASWRSFVSLGTRFVASEVNATKRPLALMPAV
jgi:hypothetical protein